MKNNLEDKVSKKEDDGSQLIAVTVRFTKAAKDVIEQVAEDNHMSLAEVVRVCVDNRLAAHLSNVIYIDEEKAGTIQETLYDLCSEIQGIHMELHRIGINYNQMVRLANIKNKYGNNTDDEFQYDKLFQEEEIKELMDNFDRVMRKAGVLWHIQG